MESPVSGKPENAWYKKDIVNGVQRRFQKVYENAMYDLIGMCLRT